jgi:hypothetical protein
VAPHTIELRVVNRLSTPFDEEVSSSFELLPRDASPGAVPNRQLWGPAHPSTGLRYDRSVRVGPEGIVPARDPEPRLILAPRESHSVTVDLHAVKWQLSHLSVWPDQALWEVAPPGEYSLWFEIGVGQSRIRSNAITVSVGAKPESSRAPRDRLSGGMVR